MPQMGVAVVAHSALARLAAAYLCDGRGRGYVEVSLMTRVSGERGSDMTVRIIDHANFVLAEHLPKLDPSISVAQAYKTLSTAGRGAFTFSEGQRDYFVKADELILSLFQGRDEGEIRELMRRTLSEALHRADPDTILPITESIEDQRDIRTLQTHLPEVFAVMRGTRKLGFLLNNPVLL